MVTLQDGVPVVKVIDFGIAKVFRQQLAESALFTRFGSILGTPQYISPEQTSILVSSLDGDTLMKTASHRKIEMPL